LLLLIAFETIRPNLPSRTIAFSAASASEFPNAIDAAVMHTKPSDRISTMMSLRDQVRL
jgi:hypothetical protein